MLSAAVEQIALSGCTFSGNRAAIAGGGASINYALQLDVAAATFDSNFAANGSGLHVTTVNAFDALYQVSLFLSPEGPPALGQKGTICDYAVPLVRP